MSLRSSTARARRGSATASSAVRPPGGGRGTAGSRAGSRPSPARRVAYADPGPTVDLVPRTVTASEAAGLRAVGARHEPPSSRVAQAARPANSARRRRCRSRWSCGTAGHEQRAGVAGRPPAPVPFAPSVAERPSSEKVMPGTTSCDEAAGRALLGRHPGTGVVASRRRRRRGAGGGREDLARCRVSTGGSAMTAVGSSLVSDGRGWSRATVRRWESSSTAPSPTRRQSWVMRAISGGTGGRRRRSAGPVAASITERGAEQRVVEALAAHEVEAAGLPQR